jgi:uncharacterized repeat protein (TIGR01451 family)
VLTDTEETTVKEPEGLRADLEITKVSNAMLIEPGRGITYTLVVTNHGPHTARDVRIVDIIPPQLTVVRTVVSQGVCDSTVACIIGDMPAGATVTVHIAVVAKETTKPGTPIYNLAWVFSDSPDPKPENNRDDEENVVGPIVALFIEKRALANEAKPGDEVKYELSVRNAGPSTAPKVVVSDTLPAGMTFLRTEPPDVCFAPQSRLVTCDLGVMVAGETRVFRVVAEVLSTPPGVVYNNAFCAAPGSYISNPECKDSVPITITEKPTNIDIVSFTATEVPDGVRVNWATVREPNTMGFHIWRSTESNFANAVQITGDMVLAKGGQGGSYQYLDTTAVPGVTYYYWLQDINLDSSPGDPPYLMTTVGGQRIFLPFVSSR